jgi:adenosylhomocysteinase
MDGFRVMPMNEAAKIGDIFITVTGNKSVLASRALRKNEGRRGDQQLRPLQRGNRHPALEKLSSGKKKRVRPFVDEYAMKDGRKSTFSAKAASSTSLPPKVIPLPSWI